MQTTGDESGRRRLSDSTCASEVDELSVAWQACLNSEQGQNATEALLAGFCAYTFNATVLEANLDTFLALVEDELARSGL